MHQIDMHSAKVVVHHDPFQQLLLEMSHGQASEDQAMDSNSIFEQEGIIPLSCTWLSKKAGSDTEPFWDVGAQFPQYNPWKVLLL
jgi:hypothetical protein